MSEIKNERWRSLFDLYDEAIEPEALVDLQREITGELIALEKIYRPQKKVMRDLRHDIRDLRYLVDAVVWGNIHPHAIRQIAIGTGKTPYMMDEEHNLDKIFRILYRLAKESDVPGFLADLTNFVRTGDMVLPVGEDGVNFIELKLNAKSKNCLSNPRVRRQIKRMESIDRYLKDGCGAIGESEQVKNCMELAEYGRETHASTLNICGIEAIEKGYSIKVLADRRLLVGVYDFDQFSTCMQTVDGLSSAWEKKTSCSLSYPQVYSWSHIKPWICKKADDDVRFAHFRGSLQFIHCFDWHTYLQQIQLENSTLDFTKKLPSLNIPGYTVKCGDDTFYLSGRVIDDFCYEIPTHDSFKRHLKVIIDAMIAQRPEDDRYVPVKK